MFKCECSLQKSKLKHCSLTLAMLRSGVWLLAMQAIWIKASAKSRKLNKIINQVKLAVTYASRHLLSNQTCWLRQTNLTGNSLQFRTEARKTKIQSIDWQTSSIYRWHKTHFSQQSKTLLWERIQNSKGINININIFWEQKTVMHWSLKL